jgi:hypothetical protein
MRDPTRTAIYANGSTSPHQSMSNMINEIVLELLITEDERPRLNIGRSSREVGKICEV